MSTKTRIALVIALALLAGAALAAVTWADESSRRNSVVN
jgi:hypothetical protein